MLDAYKVLKRFDSNFCWQHNLTMGEDMKSFVTADRFNDATGTPIAIGVDTVFKEQGTAEKYICTLRRQHLSTPAVNFVLSHKDNNLYAAEYPDMSWKMTGDSNSFPYCVSWYLDCESK